MVQISSLGTETHVPREEKRRMTSLSNCSPAYVLRGSAFPSRGVQLYLFEKVGVASPLPPFSSFLPTLKTWEEKQPASAGQPSGPGALGSRGVIPQEAKKYPRGSQGPVGAGEEAATAKRGRARPPDPTHGQP